MLLKFFTFKNREETKSKNNSHLEKKNTKNFKIYLRSYNQVLFNLDYTENYNSKTTKPSSVHFFKRLYDFEQGLFKRTNFLFQFDKRKTNFKVRKYQNS
jgi:hypothetical protein